MTCIYRLTTEAGGDHPQVDSNIRGTTSWRRLPWGGWQARTIYAIPREGQTPSSCSSGSPTTRCPLRLAEALRRQGTRPVIPAESLRSRRRRRIGDVAVDDLGRGTLSHDVHRSWFPSVPAGFDATTS